MIHIKTKLKYNQHSQTLIAVLCSFWKEISQLYKGNISCRMKEFLYSELPSKDRRLKVAEGFNGQIVWLIWSLVDNLNSWKYFLSSISINRYFFLSKMRKIPKIKCRQTPKDRSIFNEKWNVSAIPSFNHLNCFDLHLNRIQFT